MNLSISCLCLQNILKGNVISSNTLQNVYIYKTKFEKFANPIFKFDFFHSFKIIRTDFIKGLSPSVCLSTEKHCFKEYFNQKESKFSEGIFWDCSFKQINSNNVNGSAIVSYVSLDIKNCLFKDIISHSGAVYAIGALKCSLSTFCNCKSKFGGGLYCISIAPVDSVIQNTVFNKCHAEDSDGSIYVKMHGNLKMNALNATYSTANNRAGVCKIEESNVFVSFMNIIMPKSSFNSGMEAIKVKSLEIRICNFLECYQNVGSDYSCSILFIDTAPSKCNVLNSVLFNKKDTNDFFVCVIGGENKCLIENCCYTNKGRVFAGNVITLNTNANRFCSVVENNEDPTIGFSVWEQNENKAKNRKISLNTSILISVFIGFVFCLVKFIAENVIMRSIMKSKRDV